MATSTTAGTPTAPDPKIVPPKGSAAPPVSGQKSGLVPDFTAADYSRFLLAGGLCCTITHGGMTPVDVVKTRLQLEPKGSKLGMISMARQIVAAEGASGLLTGFGPTAVGYLVQGAAKFAGYEFWKRQLVLVAGSQEAAVKNRTAIYLTGASIAEVFATTLLTPLEAARIRLVSQRGYAKGLAGAVTRMAKEDGVKGFYAGFVPILFKQVPYAIGQFTVNEWMHETISKTIPKESIDKWGKAGEISIQLGCGIIAGFAAAILSHPADTLLSKINKGGGGSGSALKKLAVLAKETGPAGLFAGLGPRMLMTAGLVSGQFLLYAQIKQALGAPEGITIAKASHA